MEMKTIAQNLQAIQNSLPKQHNIKIVVVTKTRTPKEIEEAIAAGARFIGENRVQEAENKFFKIKNYYPLNTYFLQKKHLSCLLYTSDAADE